MRKQACNWLGFNTNRGIIVKALKVKDSDICGYGDWILKSKADEFVSGGFTHIELNGEKISAEICGQHDDGMPMVLLGE